MASVNLYHVDGLKAVDCSAGLYWLATLLLSGAPVLTSQ